MKLPKKKSNCFGNLPSKIDFLWNCLKKTKIFLENRILFYPDPRPPRFQTRLTPLVLHVCTLLVVYLDDPCFYLLTHLTTVTHRITRLSLFFLETPLVVPTTTLSFTLVSFRLKVLHSTSRAILGRAACQLCYLIYRPRSAAWGEGLRSLDRPWLLGSSVSYYTA